MSLLDKKETNLIIRIDQNTKSQLEVLAAEEGMNVSQYVRYLIIKEIKKSIKESLKP